MAFLLTDASFIKTTSVCRIKFCIKTKKNLQIIALFKISTNIWVDLMSKEIQYNSVDN